jgi:predicted RecA/RadA family phage recombinase
MAQTGEGDFVNGKPLMVDYTPGSAVAAGDVVVVGVVPFVCHTPIAASALGAMAAGGGVYKGLTDGSLDTGGALVFWDDTEGEFVAGTSGNTHFGYTLPDQGATADQATIRVIHSPNRAGT